MIFIDFNNLSSRMYSISIDLVLENEKKQFKKIGYTEVTNKHYNLIKKSFFNLIIKDLAFIKKNHTKTYGTMCIAQDGKKEKYWRSKIFPQYKVGRGKKNEFDKLAYKNFYIHKEMLLDVLSNLNMLVLRDVEGVFMNSDVSIEADEIIGVLSLALPQKSLAISTDKDLIQLTLNDKIRVYNPIEKQLIKWTKKQINDYNQLQLIKGQTTKKESVSIKHNTELSKEFIKYMKDTHDINVDNSMIQDINTKYQDIVKDFTKARELESKQLIKEGKRKMALNCSYFAPANFGDVKVKALLDNNTIEEILDMNPLYRERYELNKKLYLLNEVPKEIKQAIIKAYSDTEIVYEDSIAKQTFMDLGIDLSLLEVFK